MAFANNKATFIILSKQRLRIQGDPVSPSSSPTSQQPEPTINDWLNVHSHAVDKQPLYSEPSYATKKESTSNKEGKPQAPVAMATLRNLVPKENDEDAAWTQRDSKHQASSNNYTTTFGEENIENIVHLKRALVQSYQKVPGITNSNIKIANANISYTI